MKLEGCTGEHPAVFSTLDAATLSLLHLLHMERSLG
jgi:hypothetical protein